MIVSNRLASIIKFASVHARTERIQCTTRMPCRSVMRAAGQVLVITPLCQALA
jgi:hypothetical protein